MTDAAFNIFSLENQMVLRAVFPCLVIILLGRIVGKYDNFENEKTLSSLIYFVFSPCLIFTGLIGHSFHRAEFVILGGAAILMLLLLLPLAFYLKNLAKARDNGYILPMLFMSSGTILMPLSLLLYGNEGLAKGAIFHLFSSLLFFTFGHWLSEGKARPLHFFRTPSFLAALLAIGSTALPLNLPAALSDFFSLAERGIEIVGYGAIPMLLLSFGYSLRQKTFASLLPGLPGGLYRMLVGPATAFSVVLIFRETGLISTVRDYNILSYIDARTTEAVIVLAGATPGAMSCYLLNKERGNGSSDSTLSMLVAGSLLGVVTIPLVLFIVNSLILSS